jgi:hypothetical protein
MGNICDGSGAFLVERRIERMRFPDLMIPSVAGCKAIERSYSLNSISTSSNSDSSTVSSSNLARTSSGLCSSIMRTIDAIV